MWGAALGAVSGMMGGGGGGAVGGGGGPTVGPATSEATASSANNFTTGPSTVNFAAKNQGINPMVAGIAGVAALLVIAVIVKK